MANRSLCDAAVVYLVNKYTRGLDSDCHSKVRNYILILRAAIVVACVVHIFKVVLTPLDGLAYVVLANAVNLVPSEIKTAIADTPLENFAVVYIDGNRHADHYSGRSPLPRDKLVADLKKIYAAKPKIVAIDLDLSPTFDAMKAEASDDFRKQGELNDLLDANAEKTILITPFPMDEGPRNKYAGQKLKWMIDRCSSEDKDGNPKTPAVFAEPHLRETFGYVIEYFDKDFALGKLIYPHLTAKTRNTEKRSKSPCELAHESLCSGKPQDNIYLNSDNWESTSEDKKIHFKILDTWVRGINLCDIFQPGDEGTCRNEADKTKNEQTSIEGKVILFGANYGQDDLYTTPLGAKYGLNLHAAIAASEATPISFDHAIDVILDVVVGFLFGLWVHKAWGKYFEFATSPESEPDSFQNGSKRLRAYRWLVALIGGYFFILVALIVFSFWLLSFGIWLSPIAISVGMLIHGFAEGSVSVAKHQLRRLQTLNSTVTSIEPVRNSSSGFAITLPCLMWIGIVGFVFFKLFLHILYQVLHHVF
jgi:CHASE2 domain